MLANMIQPQPERAVAGASRWRGATGLGARVALLGVLVLVSCGGDTSQASARDQVTQARCDWAASCGYVGAGKTYSSMDNCLVQVRANWDAYWPASDCDGKIKGSQLDLCLGAIPLVACGDVADLATSLAVNCSKAKICSGP